MAIWTSDGGGTTPGGTVTEVTATGSGAWISDNLVRVSGITMAEAAEIFADEASAHAATALQYRNETEEYASAAAIVALDIGAASAAAAMALASADEASDHAAIALDYTAQASSHAANAMDYAAQALASADAASAVAATVASYASSIAFITVTQAVNLDTIESDTVTNNAKVTNATHTGDVTGSAALTISNDVVSNAKLANMATQTIKGRTTAGTGDPEDLTAAQARSVIGISAANTPITDVGTYYTGTDVEAALQELGVLNPITAFSDDATFAGDSATVAKSEKSIKAYVDSFAIGTSIGTWTPTLLDDTLSTLEGQTYTFAVGQYFIIGKILFFNFQIQMSSLGTLTGSNNAYIGGLPVASASLINYGGGGSIDYTANVNVANASGHGIQLGISTSVGYIILYQMTPGTSVSTQVTIDEITSTGRLYGHGQYFID